MIAGWSMGALQAYERAVRYPGMVASILPKAGAAKLPPHNLVFLEGAKAARRRPTPSTTGAATEMERDYASLRSIASGYAGNLRGAIGSTWPASVGGGNGRLGYPVTNEICGLANGGCYQGLQGSRDSSSE
jgi:hypothetical protein